MGVFKELLVVDMRTASTLKYVLIDSAVHTSLGVIFLF